MLENIKISLYDFLCSSGDFPPLSLLLVAIVPFLLPLILDVLVPLADDSGMSNEELWRRAAVTIAHSALNLTTQTLQR